MKKCIRHRLLRQIEARDVEIQQLKAKVDSLTTWTNRMIIAIEVVLSVGFSLPERAKEALREAIQHGRRE